MHGSLADRSVRAALHRLGYVLVRELGEGGMGQAWAAIRVGAMGAVKPCVLKTILPRLVDDPEHRHLFMVEGRTSMMLGHANIVSAFDLREVQGWPVLAMDWVDGVDLADFGRRIQRTCGRPMAVADAVHITGALLEAVGYLHALGVTHHDISPRNVMVSARGEIKLMDFGLARQGRGSAEFEAQTFRGTLRYLAREQVRGRPEPASDLFGVGAILHELLGGVRFRDDCDGSQTLMAEILMGDIPPLLREIPAVVDEVRRGLLQPRAERRYHSAHQPLRRFESWSGYRNRRGRIRRLYRHVVGEPRCGALGPWLTEGELAIRLEAVRRAVSRPVGAGAALSALDPLAGPARPFAPAAVPAARVFEPAAVHPVAIGRARGGVARLGGGCDDEEITRPWPGSSGSSLFPLGEP